jgi:AcrR family transcriptional regulator
MPTASSPPARTATRGPSSAKTARTRASIVRAAFEEFIDKGFAAAKVADISVRAGIAKGTIYRYFPTKEDLFVSVLRAFIAEGKIELQNHPRLTGETVGDYLRRTLLPVIACIESSGRARIARLVLAESAQFPVLAEAYVREVHAPLLEEIRRLAQLALDEGELRDDALVRYPHLLLGSNWIGMAHNGMLTPEQPLDIGAMFACSIDLVFGKSAGNTSGASQLRHHDR